ncbi:MULTISPECIES: hypothetical protein [Arenibacter]|uniref:hypothetical protein n=1 Tax=Arenibacter TaxID=178469 RepID=UPI0012FFEB47|nr:MULTISPECIES: hypothetical protein [Arenibacter]
MHLVYGEIEVNLVAGVIQLQDITLGISNRDSGVILTEMQMEAIRLKGFGYFNYFFGNTIGANKIKLLNPKVRYYSNNSSKEINSDSILLAGTEKVFTLDRLEIVDGEIVVIRKETNTIKLMAEKLNLSVEDLKTDRSLFKMKIPFAYGKYSLSTGRMFLDIDPFEILTIKGSIVEGNELQLSNLNLKTKYDRKEFSQRLKKEHDHLDLTVEEVKLSKIDFGFNSERFFLKSGSMVVQQPILSIYRDKLVADDLMQKKLYSQKLREMRMDLDISEISIINGYISYAELVNEGSLPGELVFSDLDASLKNISNTDGNMEEAKIEARALLMGSSPIQLQWNFRPSKENDAFYVSGIVKDFESESINQFLKSNLRTKAEGSINELYFTISGDNTSSKGDIKMKYRDFRFMVLKKDRLGVNKFLTFLGNMITNDGSKTDDMGYRYGEIYVERDTTKSFFNYLWLNVMDGIMNTLTGDGKKD